VSARQSNNGAASKGKWGTRGPPSFSRQTSKGKILVGNMKRVEGDTLKSELRFRPRKEQGVLQNLIEGG